MIDQRSGIPVATGGDQAVAVCSWDAGSPQLSPGLIEASFETAEGSSALIALSMAHQEPLVFPPRSDVERRLGGTIASWRRWADAREASGPWRDQIVRSALALKLLVQAKSGSVAAAPTTSLPEEIGGERNWDYRFSWLRDSAFVMDAMLALECRDEAEAFFWWLMHASQITHPRMQVLYRMDGGADAPERPLPLDGYEGSRPVRVGNGAAKQAQLDIYGDVMQMAWLYAEAGYPIDREFGDRLAGVRRPRVRPLVAAGLGHLGDPRSGAASHPVEDDVLGGARPCRPTRHRRSDPVSEHRQVALRGRFDRVLHRGTMLVVIEAELHASRGCRGPRCERPPRSEVRLWRSSWTPLLPDDRCDQARARPWAVPVPVRQRR